eukprot:CAMPEP_0176487510 /NCGR_PEP_ID=MMETSP0200_2-20121128/6177_1 /TAXON_ID=947934 /ORGANISM="Chaetoceros sp., Strain GSL56" /LENGTH=154 /DNA_ID=CAMNT_0017884357 /DNA_START=646 /DNA_END=1110 /DNA_ORIENTATION=-
MAILSFMIYYFSYVIYAARCAKQHRQDFFGLSILKKGDESQKSSHRYNDSGSCGRNEVVVKKCAAVPCYRNENTTGLNQSFTPGEIKELIQENLTVIVHYFGKCFTQEKLQVIYDNLDKLEEKANVSGVGRSLTLEKFDDTFQCKECVYGIVVR